ncbi:DNA damage-regulated autophagy modulator protein 1-like [Hyla sarda]|uniref:DNA damage-regulated autophagy modulator protein 1-like n=1 Tax=Hyla sarda TaxID=327740 RepID=UPI0024C2B5C2|nr:DNA damage-regulated autophagy modulator protein 1-like [Hyla sarda]
MVFLFVSWTSTGFITTYTLQAMDHKGSPYPDIRLPGSFLPQSWVIIGTLFGCALLGSIMTIIFYVFHITLYEDNCDILFQRALLGLGLCASFGTGITAIAQLLSSSLLHMSGVAMAFVCGAFYNIMQSRCLYETSCNPRIICHLRMALSITITIMMLIFYANFTQQLFSLCGEPECEEVFNDAAEVAWWVAIACFLLQVITYYKDFQRLYMEISGGMIIIAFREKLYQELP